MFFANFLVFLTMMENKKISYNSYFKKNYSLRPKYSLVSNNIETTKIGIVDFRNILKKSNAMKVLTNKFLSLEKEINQKIKQKQAFLKSKEQKIIQNKNNLSNIDYKEKIRLFKAEVFQVQKKYNDERSKLNKSFQKIQKDIKDLLAQVIKDVSIKKKINVVLLKENVFLFNDLSIDFTKEVLDLFNDKTKSIKITVISSD